MRGGITDMTATTSATQRALTTFIGLLIVTGVSVWALTYSSTAARSQASRGAPGSEIAFTRTEHALPGTDESNLAEIWVMNSDGADRRRLTNNDTFDLGAVWSPDGHMSACYSVDPVTGPHIFLIPAAGGDQTQLTEMRSRFPSWSENDKIAFDNGGPTSGDIFVSIPDGSAVEQLTNSPAARNIRPDWSPDGDKIAFVSRRTGSDDIYVMNDDGSDVIRLTTTSKPDADNAPRWSPDGEKIAFQRTLNGHTEIYTMNADGTDQTRLTSNYPARNQNPVWSPDGQEIAFERDVEPIASRTLQIFVMNADGSDQKQITGLDFPGDPSQNNHAGWGREHPGRP